MNSRIAVGMAISALALLGLSACSADTAGSSTSSAAPATSTPEASSMTTSEPTESMDDSGVALETAESALGTIVVDGDGMTVYQFDNDTQGGDSSTCTGQCATNWPAVPGSAAPELEGITGTVATIIGIDGEPQLTLNGWPLYYFAGDAAPGDTNGQGVGGVWWVLTPAGELIKG
ncbi:hypothetical protein [Demequina sp.]|uniref:COG4315 family predicted lipoprotein n=1 Tax=Demequina sp. TaxID=2050685 RepID=UPI0025BBA4AE|nr:hypothetical protein [Demequina sp.]